MNNNFTKLCALIIVGGVAKALFAPVRPINPAVSSVAHRVGDAAADKLGEVAAKAPKA